MVWQGSISIDYTYFGGIPVPPGLQHFLLSYQIGIKWKRFVIRSKRNIREKGDYSQQTNCDDDDDDDGGEPTENSKFCVPRETIKEIY